MRRNASFPAVEAHLASWLAETANVRTHAVTGEAPQVRYARDERPVMGAYLSPGGIAELGQPPVQTRKADKTGLIAYRANKYSIPLAYQRTPVGVLEEDGLLLICALDSGEVIARHPVASGKGEVLKNTHHYRDRSQQIAEPSGTDRPTSRRAPRWAPVRPAQGHLTEHLQGPAQGRQVRPGRPSVDPPRTHRGRVRQAASDRYGAARLPGSLHRPSRAPDRPERRGMRATVAPHQPGWRLALGPLRRHRGRQLRRGGP